MFYHQVERWKTSSLFTSKGQQADLFLYAESSRALLGQCCILAVMLKFITAVMLMLLTSPTYAQGVVQELLSKERVKVSFEGPERPAQGEKLLILSGKNEEVVAIGKLSEDAGEVEILETIQDALVLVGDKAEKLNPDLLRKIPGFTSITTAEIPELPAQYKDLVHLGVFTAEGHTLSRTEWLISPFQVQYGITNDFGLKVFNPLTLDGYANLGLKYRFFNNEHVRFTMNTFGAYQIPQRDWIWQIGGILTRPTNAKFLNHLVFNFTTEPQLAENAAASANLNLFEESDIRNINEYILDNWDRILFGVSYSVELQTFGGTISYMWIWDSFHINAGLGTRNFTELSFGPDGYYAVYDFFWRF